MDLELPQTNVEVTEVMTIPAEPKIKFKEKTVGSISSKLPAVFHKKKKKGIGYRNLKARTDDL